MGKANKQRQAQAKKTRTDKIVAAVCIVFAVLIVGTLVFTAINESGILLRTNNVVSNDEAEVNAAMMSFFLNNNIINWYNQYGSYISYGIISMNPAADLKTQNLGSMDKYYLNTAFEGTWYDYFMSTTLEEVKMYVACAKAAAAEGIELSEEELDSIDADIKTLKESFRTSGLTFSDWFGKGVNESDVRKCYNLMYLRDKYVEHKYEVIEDAIEAEKDLSSINKYISENKEQFYTADVLKYTIKVSSKGLTDKEYEAKVAAAKEAAQKITAAGNDVEAYIAAIEEYEAAQKADKNDKTETGTETGTETETETEVETSTGSETEKESSTEKETTEKSLEDKIEDLKENIAFATDTDTEEELEDWLFEESAENGEMSYFEETSTETEEETTTKASSGKKDGSEAEDETDKESDDKKKKTYNVYTVNTYYVYKASDLDRELTHNFAYLVSNDSQQIFDFIKKFNAEDNKTLDGFYDIADKMYKDVHEDENHQHSSDEFFEYNKLEKQPANAFGTNYAKLNEWIEDEARKDGELSEKIEVTIVNTNSSSGSTSKPTTTKQYAVIYFEKHNVPTWQAYGQVGAVNEDFDEWFDEQCKSIDTDEKSINNIDTTIQTIVSLYSGY